VYVINTACSTRQFVQIAEQLPMLMRQMYASECVCVVGHIKRTDGFLGLYRGLTPRLFSAIVSTLVANAVNTVSITNHFSC